jgi:molybdopterin-guanine dinucleotide biosynthesis protein A
MDFQQGARLQRFQRLSRHQCRQWTFQPGEVEFCRGHALYIACAGASRQLVAENVRKVGSWTARYRLATVTWPAEPFDPFFNANTPDDIAAAERLAELDEG